MKLPRPAFRSLMLLLLLLGAFAPVAVLAGRRPGDRAGRGARAPSRRRGEHPPARPEPGRFPRLHRTRDPALRAPGLRPRPALRPLELHPGEEPAGAPLDGGDLRPDLRDLQGLHDPAGQAAARAARLHRHGDRGVLPAHRAGDLQDRHHPAVQRDRHGGQLRGRLVRHPDQHLRQLPDRVREPPREGVAGERYPAARGDERGHDADLGRAAVHARHPALHSGRRGGGLLPGLRHRRVARRRGAPDRGRHLHQDRRHRGRPHEGRLQDQGR